MSVYLVAGHNTLEGNEGNVVALVESNYPTLVAQHMNSVANLRIDPRTVVILEELSDIELPAGVKVLKGITRSVALLNKSLAVEE